MVLSHIAFCHWQLGHNSDPEERIIHFPPNNTNQLSGYMAQDSNKFYIAVFWFKWN